jgi:DNA-binding PadR family transcriptional regulator
MKGSFLGEFEEVVLLAVCTLDNDAYSNRVRSEVEKHTQRSINLSAIHSALYRMEKKGYLSSELGPASNKRGGKPKRIFKPTHAAVNALKHMREVRDSLWSNVPQVLLNKNTI